jgi:hypothetical protein
MNNYKVTQSGIASPNDSVDVFCFETEQEANIFVQESIQNCISNLPRFDYNGEQIEYDIEQERANYSECYDIEINL